MGPPSRATHLLRDAVVSANQRIFRGTRRFGHRIKSESPSVFGVKVLQSWSEGSDKLASEQSGNKTRELHDDDVIHTHTMWLDNGEKVLISRV
jgi:hypothetical protein